MNVCVCVTDSHNVYPAVWINAPANDRTMANYNLKTPKKNIISWRECGKEKKKINDSRHASRESNRELSNHDVAILTILRDVRWEISFFPRADHIYSLQLELSSKLTLF